MERASDLVRWLSNVDAEMTAVVEVGTLRLDSRRGLSCELDGLGNVTQIGLDLVWLPIDGPDGSIDRVIAGLPARLGEAHRRTAVVADPGPGLPPDPVLLKKVAARGMIPGVDLSRCSFVDDGRVWVAGVDRLVGLDIDLGSAVGQRQLADIAVGFGLFDARFAGTPWTRDVGGGRHLGSPTEWSHVLGAHYVHEALVALAAGGAAS